jgi:hypothetical protein
MFHFFPNQPKLEFFFKDAGISQNESLPFRHHCRLAITRLPPPVWPRQHRRHKELTKLVHDYSQQYRLASSENPLSLALEQRLCHGSSA